MSTGELPPYSANAAMDSQGRDIVVVSDLHMSAGKGVDGNYSGTENFFADGAFPRFIRSLDGEKDRKTILVINGDFVDFLRVTELPDEEPEFAEWLAMLDSVGITTFTVEDLKGSIDDRERKYGLKTHEFKSVWKLARVVKGHPEVFAALAYWLEQGHSLVITKGNHDLEWYWPGVRNYLRLALAGPGLNALPALYFIDDSILFDGVFHIEHGHKRDKFTTSLGSSVLKGGLELNLPFGSFFNRYLLNRIELVFPYLDNVRPAQNLLPMLFEKDFALGLKVLFQHFPFMLRMIPKKYFRYMFKDFLVFLLAVAAPIAVMIALIGKMALSDVALPQSVSKALSAILMPVLSYFLTRLLARFKLIEPDYLSDDARKFLARHENVRFVTMGHTHNPQQFREQERWYFNTGTWIPIVEASSQAIREDRTYTYLHLRHDETGAIQPAVLMRWNDDARSSEPLVLVCPKK
jgi:UDP-2,3-diacylglucosamine pyrophosphatase LpxH